MARRRKSVSGPADGARGRIPRAASAKRDAGNTETAAERVAAVSRPDEFARLWRRLVEILPDHLVLSLMTREEAVEVKAALAARTAAQRRADRLNGRRWMGRLLADGRWETFVGRWRSKTPGAKARERDEQIARAAVESALRSACPQQWTEHGAAAELARLMLRQWPAHKLGAPPKPETLRKLLSRTNVPGRIRQRLERR